MSTYDGGHIGIFHVTGDCNRLDQELVLTLRIGTRLLLHSLEKNCTRSVSFVASKVL